MKTKNFKIGLIGIFLAIIIVSGCMGGGDEEKIETTLAGEEPAGEIKESPEQGVEKVEKSFSDLLNLGKPQGYTISYDITGKNMDGKSEMTMYFAGEKKMRMDSITKSGGITSEGSIFIMGDDMHACTKTEGGWTCIIFEGDTESGLEGASGVFEEDPEKPSYDGAQNIAGVTAECYKLESGGTKYRYCIHPEKYLMLLGETYINGNLESKIIATNVDLNMPKNSVFELPAEPMDIESMMGDPCAVCNMLSGEEKMQCLESC